MVQLLQECGILIKQVKLKLAAEDIKWIFFIINEKLYSNGKQFKIQFLINIYIFYQR